MDDFNLVNTFKCYIHFQLLFYSNRPNQTTSFRNFYCSLLDDESLLVSPKYLDSWKSLWRAATIRNYRPLLDLAENVKEGENPLCQLSEEVPYSPNWQHRKHNGISSSCPATCQLFWARHHIRGNWRKTETPKINTATLRRKKLWQAMLNFYRC